MVAWSWWCWTVAKPTQEMRDFPVADCWCQFWGTELEMSGTVLQKQQVRKPVRCGLFERQERQLIRAEGWLEGRGGFLSHCSLFLIHSESHSFTYAYICSREISPAKCSPCSVASAVALGSTCGAVWPRRKGQQCDWATPFLWFIFLYLHWSWVCFI